MGEHKKGRTNLVKLRNNGKAPIMRPTNAKRDDGTVVSRPKKVAPGKTAMFNGDNRAIRIYALGFAGRPGNPKADPPLLPIPARAPALVPVDDRGREWLKEVQAEADRIAAELDE